MPPCGVRIHAERIATSLRSGHAGTKNVNKTRGRPFHTFVWDGPGFSIPIDIEVGEVVERDGFVFCDVLGA
jgi:hypothetical protein